ncbi:hypothetical protein HUT15_36130 (plasmid) [Streptomyces sp. NA03103]|uniref:Uncharacterized protein n=1 Tax=Streptomyces salinarius TaxID=2762598 RepID=A0ABW8BLT8_9ACTN|nr:hypothetical protein [Streptomyces sp. NA03103]QKW65972.1 hypothetical protein HUT15_36130 [Streptomyces sp. NA03103]
MDGELITAIVAVAVSVVGIVYTSVQTKTAKKAAEAAQGQVELMRRQIEAEEEDRFENRGPVFSVERAYTDESDVNVPRALVRIKQGSGPRLVSVVVSATGDGVDGMRNNSDSEHGYSRAPSIDLGTSTPGALHDVYVDLDFDTRKTDVHLTLACVDEAGARWVRPLGTRVEPEPAPPRGQSRRFRG